MLETILLASDVILLGIVGFLLMRPELQFPETMPMCPDCGTRFRALRGLLHHMQATHPDRFDSPPKDGPYR